MRAPIGWKPGAGSCFDPSHRGGRPHGLVAHRARSPAVAAGPLSAEAICRRRRPLPLVAHTYEGKFPDELHPQVETAEISDADLDAVSGGLSLNAVGTVTGLVDGVAPVSGLVNTAVNTVEGVTGLNTAPVTGLVAGL